MKFDRSFFRGTNPLMIDEPDDPPLPKTNRHGVQRWRYRSSSRRKPTDGFALGMLALLLSGVAIFGFIDFQKIESRIITVCEKDRVATDTGGQYRIYTDVGTFQLSDSIIGKVRFDTADVYGRVEEDTTYQIRYKGWRVPLMSWFPNILEFTALPEGQQNPSACT